MSANNEIPGNPGLRGVVAPSAIQGASRTLVQRRRRYNPSKSLVGQLLTSNDPAVLLASVRCWTSHSNLTYVLDGDGRQNDALIEDLGVERRRAIAALAKTPSKGIEGIRLKNKVLMFVIGDFEESALLLRSCLLDCDRVLRSELWLKSIDYEPELALDVAKFFSMMSQLDDETCRQDECEDDAREAQRSELFLITENLVDELEATINAIAQHSTDTRAGLTAKLDVFEMCDQFRASGFGLILLSRAMFRDFDRLLRQHVRKSGRLCEK